MVARFRRSADRSARVRALVCAFAVLLMSVVGVSMTATPAYACSCKTANFKKLLQQADTVMVATVDHVRPIEADAASGEEADADADSGVIPAGPGSLDTVEAGEVMRVVARRVFKGELDQARVEVTSDNTGSCGWYDPETDERLLLLVRDGHVGLCTGSRPATTKVVQQVQRQLGVGEKMPAPPPREASRVRIESSEPVDFGRLAAPGGAMVLVGLLGLAVVSRLNRS